MTSNSAAIFRFLCILLEILVMSQKNLIQSQEAEAQGEVLVSLIYGLGIPWDVSGGSMTTGYAIRIPYAFPMKIKEWKSPYAKYFKKRHTTPASNTTKLESTTSLVQSKKYVPNEENTDEYRWIFYHALDMYASRLGYNGRACVLRSICEAGAIPFDWRSGVIGEVLHILFTPSSSSEPLSKHSDNEYFHAERLGKLGAPCDRIFKACTESLLDRFSLVSDRHITLYT